MKTGDGQFIQRITPSPGPGVLKCYKAEAQSIAQNVWTTIVNLNDGPGVITCLWFACSAGGRTSLEMKIAFDGADIDTPQIHGIAGELFGSGFDTIATPRTLFVGASKSDTDKFSGYLKLPMPYYSSVRIDLKGSTSNGSYWVMVERMSVTNADLYEMGLKPGMHLKTAGWGLEGYKTSYSEITLLETNTPTILAGIFHFGRNTNDANSYRYLEGNYKIYYGGEETASYESSGAEDFYFSSWYFLEGAYESDDTWCAFRGVAGSYVETAVGRMFYLNKAPYHPNGLKFTWNVGQNGQGDPGTVYTRWKVWYYE